jgi:imidazolonepropionase-like amidohydrolase
MFPKLLLLARLVAMKFAQILCFGVAVTLASSLDLASADENSSDQPQGLRRNVPSVWVLQDADLVSRPGVVARGVSVLIRDDRIESVGKNLPAPVGARVVNLKGKTIYPCLIDAFTEQKLEKPNASARYWNSQIRPATHVAEAYSGDSSVNSILRKQGVGARLVAPAGGVVKGFSAIVLTSDVSAKHAILRADGTQHVRLTASRNGSRVYPNSPMGAVALARQSLYDAEWYRGAWSAAEADSTLPRPERNIDLLAWNEVRDSRVPLIIDTSNELFFLRADRFAREFGLSLIVHGSGNEYRRLDEIAATGRTVILPVNFPKPPNVGTIEASLDVTTESLMHWDLAPENPKRLAAAGVTFAFCSQGLEDRGKFLAQVRKAVERGLHPNEALRALTTVPAVMFGVEDQVGTVEPGRLASLVVTDGPLFDSETKIVETWVAGERFEFSEEPQRKVAGNWTLTLAAPPKKFPGEFTVSIEDSKKLTGNIATGTKPDGKGVDLGRLVLNGTRLSVTFRSDDFGQKGVAQLTAVIDPKSDNATGNLVLPNGRRLVAELSKQPPSESDKDDAKADDEEKSDAGKGEGKGGAAGEDKLASKDEKKKKPAGASFPVNYPLGAFGLAKQPEQPKSVLFKNATVWTCGRSGILKNADVLIGDGKILKIGLKLKASKDVQIVDATGMHLTPGIIDCHSHFATDGGVNESGQAVTAEVRIGDFIDCDDINIYRQLAGGVTSSNILHGSANPIGGQNQVVKLRWGAGDEALKFSEAPQGIKFALGENVKQSNWGDEFKTRYPQTRMGVEQLFRDEFRAALEYEARWKKWNQRREGLPPRRDLELDAIVEILDGKRWIHCHSYRQDEILALIRVLDEFKIRIGTFQHILEGYKVADAMAKHGAMGSAFSDWWAYKFEVYDAIPYAGALMHNAGVVVSFNSDDRELARHLNHEAAKAVKYGGVSPEEALKFVTLNPAKQLRIERHVGSIEPGKHADVVLWSASPLSTMSRCEQTWIDGRKYFDRATDRSLRARNQRIRTALIQKILDSGEPMRNPGEGDGDPASLWPREDLFCHGHDHDDHHHE